MLQVGAGYQLSDDLYGSLTFERYDVDLQDGNTAFQAYQLHEMASGDHHQEQADPEGALRPGGRRVRPRCGQYDSGSFEPDFGGGFVPQIADAQIHEGLRLRVGSPGFRGRFGGWNSLTERDFNQHILKACMKVQF